MPVRMDSGSGQCRPPESRTDPDRDQAGMENRRHQDKGQTDTLPLGFARHTNGRQRIPHSLYLSRREGDADRLCPCPRQTPQTVPPTHEIALGKERIYALPSRTF